MMKPRIRFTLWSVLAACLLVNAGCGKGTYPVQGMVRFEDGKPATELAGGFVNFQAVDQEISAQGDIKPDGSFVLSTHKEDDGAAPGKYRVIVTQPPYRGPQLIPPQLIDPEFSKQGTTPLEVTVEAKSNQFRLDVRRGKGETKTKGPVRSSR